MKIECPIADLDSFVLAIFLVPVAGIIVAARALCSAGRRVQRLMGGPGQ